MRYLQIPRNSNHAINRNPYIPTKNVYITNCPGVTFIFPNTPQFKDMKVYVEGEEIDWKTDGFIAIPE